MINNIQTREGLNQAHWIDALQEKAITETNNTIEIVKDLENTQNKISEYNNSNKKQTDINYWYYWWTWILLNDISDQINKENELKVWTNIDWENAEYQKDNLEKTWMVVELKWKQVNFVISNIDETDKYSSWYNNCTGVILFWIDKNTGKSISMLSHQNPNCFLKDKQWFEIILSKRLKEFSDRCKEWSIKSFIWGGNIWNQEKNITYNESKSFISDIIKKTLKQEPEILPPNNNKWVVLIKISTKENRINILQPMQNKWEQKTEESNQWIQSVEPINQRDSEFIEKLSNTKKWKKLLFLIEEKKKEYINIDDRENIKKHMPNLYNLWIPIFIGSEGNEQRTLRKQRVEKDQESFQYLKVVDKIIGELPIDTKEEMKKLLINIVVFADSWAWGNATLNIWWKRHYNTEEEIKWVLFHEFTHVKHQAIAYSDNFFSKKINIINKDKPKHVDVMIAAIPSWKYIWFEKNDIKKQKDLSIEFTTWEKIELYWSWIKYWKEWKTTEEMWGLRWVYKYLKNLMWPRYWFINPYSIKWWNFMNSYENLLWESVKVRMNVEELSNIIEEYYINKENFKEIMFWNKWQKELPLNEKYDTESKHPLLRQKLRLMIEYWFFPKWEFDQYFEK